ncbi:MAG: ATP-dependent helicase [Chloroflexi bacterium]|nr:ATP-dependent helicase [Chloroflexota bacterium]
MTARRPHPRIDQEPVEGGPTAAPVALEVVRPLLRGLDRDQRRAVTHRSGPLLVVAGPGTGKTEVITRRIAWLIATKRALPRQILALTFTDKAAAEMQARVDLLVPYGQAACQMLTFHAFGDRLLREHGHALGLPPDPRVIGRGDQVTLLRDALFTLGLDRYLPLGDPTRFLGALADVFARAKDEGIGPEDLAAWAHELAAGVRAVAADAPPEARDAIEALLDEAASAAELARAYGRYQELLRDKGLIDFGDQVSLATRLLQERPAVAAAVADRYRHVLVDEAQDMDPIQLDLLRRVAGHRQLTLVGDDDQAIYAFRGAAVEHLLTLSDDPDMTRVVLRTSHRSRTPILEAAHRLIRHNDPWRLEARHGLDKRLRARRRSRRPVPVTDLAFRTVEEEADAIATSIATRIEAGASPRDVAILVRTNADASHFVRSLAVRGLPVRTGVGEPWSRAPEVRDLLAFLRVIADPEASTDLYAVAAGAPYRLGGPDLTALTAFAARRHRPLLEVLRDVHEQPGVLRLAEYTRDVLVRLLSDLDAAVVASHVESAGAVLYGHLRRSGRYQELVSAAERGDDAPLRRVARLFQLLTDRGALVADARLASLLPHLDAVIASDGEPDMDGDVGDVDAVAVLTVHKAKGLEFPVVYVAGLVEGRFPMRGRADRIRLPDVLGRRVEVEEATWAEERRLCYVAMTRARDELILSHAVRATPGGRVRRPSPFLAEALDRAPSTVEGEGTAAMLLREPVAVVESVPGTADPDAPLTLSHSQIDDYLTCPLRYRLRHLAKVPTPPHHALVLGNALHQAVAAWHAAELRGAPLDEPAVLAAFGTHWSGEGFLSREHEDARYVAGEDALRRFLAEPRDADRRTIDVERTFQVTLDGDVVRGRYDRVDEGPDGVIISDYKSSDVREQQVADARARDSMQLQLYALAWEAETGAPPAALELRFLDSGLVGRTRPDARRAEKARAALARAASGIRAERFEAKPDLVGCTYCPYRDICPSAAR